MTCLSFLLLVCSFLIVFKACWLYLKCICNVSLRVHSVFPRDWRGLRAMIHKRCVRSWRRWSNEVVQLCISHQSWWVSTCVNIVTSIYYWYIRILMKFSFFEIGLKWIHCTVYMQFYSCSHLASDNSYSVYNHPSFHWHCLQALLNSRKSYLTIILWSWTHLSVFLGDGYRLNLWLL